MVILQATSFLIPYDFYPDVMYAVDSDLKQTWSWHGVLEQAPVVIQLLKDSIYFQRNQGSNISYSKVIFFHYKKSHSNIGADHLLIVSWSAEYDTLIIRTRTIPLFELCQRCLKLTVEDFSFLFPPSLRSKQRQIKGDNWYEIKGNEYFLYCFHMIGS